MARQKQPAPQTTIAVHPELAQAIAASAVQLPAQALTPELEERDRANQLLGRIQLSDGVSKLLTVSSLVDLGKIKESRSYRHLTAMGADGKLLTVSSWEDFCGLLGRSRAAIDEDLRNLDALGADALNSMQRAGLGYRELRRLRKLPEDDRRLIAQEVEADAGDKDAILALIDEISARHVNERNRIREEADAAWQAQKDRVMQLENEKRGQDRVIGDLTSRNKELHTKLESMQSQKPDAVLQRNTTELADLLTGLMVGETGIQSIRLWLSALWRAHDEMSGELPPRQLREQAAQGIVRALADLRYLLDEFGLGADEDSIVALAGEQWTPGAGGFEVDEPGAEDIEA